MNTIWWNSVSNAVRFVNSIASEMSNGHNVIYSVPERTEWIDMLRETITERFEGSSRGFIYINAAEQDKSPGELLLTEYVDLSLQEGYRTSIGYEKFLADVDHLTDLVESYVYVQAADNGQLKEWSKFINGYRKHHTKNSPMCLFLLESIGDKAEIRSGMSVVEYKDYIRSFDIHIFCLLISSGIKLNSIMHTYAAELATLFSGGDPELAAELIGQCHDFIRNPEQVLQTVVNEHLRSDNTPFRTNGNIHKYIWQAQVKTFLPLIERYRMQLIHAYECDFPKKETITDTFGRDVEDIFDIELGTIKFLCDDRQMYIPRQDYDKLCMYRECRNKLAHNGIIDFEVLQYLADSVS